MHALLKGNAMFHSGEPCFLSSVYAEMDYFYTCLNHICVSNFRMFVCDDLASCKHDQMHAAVDSDKMQKSALLVVEINGNFSF